MTVAEQDVWAPLPRTLSRSHSLHRESSLRTRVIDYDQAHRLLPRSYDVAHLPQANRARILSTSTSDGWSKENKIERVACQGSWSKYPRPTTTLVKSTLSIASAYSSFPPFLCIIRWRTFSSALKLRWMAVQRHLLHRTFTARLLGTTESQRLRFRYKGREPSFQYLQTFASFARSSYSPHYNIA
ncbi:hypothetical protein BDY19DRAFT_452278 [Irpex rosettiformis]|uniref:Uncharacterized protein n=1 Tax=Irpex rosettiformis TaxID=378272 RepID=A0ACB8TTL5_9APHY|nr:hypothetical protein BDY19DRAFT_452278 [Irpex rosettiformis]